MQIVENREEWFVAKINTKLHQIVLIISSYSFLSKFYWSIWFPSNTTKLFLFSKIKASLKQVVKENYQPSDDRYFFVISNSVFL